MKRFLKISAITLVAILALLIVLPFVFKGKIVELVKTEINKSVNAKVDFKDFSMSIFSSFPDFKFSIKGLSIVGNEPFAGDTLAYLPKLSLILDLNSVFKGETYEIKSIYLDEPYINVIVLSDGRSNYDIALEDTSTTEEDTTSSSFSMALRRFEIENAKIIYDDHESDMRADILDFDMNLKGDMTEATTDLTLTAAIESLTYEMEGLKYLNKSKANLDAVILADLEKYVYTFKENELILNNLLLNFDGWVAMPESDIDMDLTFSAPKADFKTLLSLVPAIYLSDMEGLKATGKAAFSGFAKGVYNDELMPAFGVKMLVENGRFQYPDLPQAVENVNIKADINSPSSDMDKITIDVSKFHFEVAKNPMDIKLFLKTPMSDPDIDAVFKGKFNLADVDKFYPLGDSMKVAGLMDMDVALKGKQSSIDNERYNEFKAEGFLKLADFSYWATDLPDGVQIPATQMSFTPAYISLDNFTATYLKNTISADGKLSNYIDYVFGDGTIMGNLNLKSDYLNINELMGSSTETETATAADTAAMEAFEVPDNIDFVLKTLIGRIKYDNLDMSSVYGQLHIAESRVNLEDMNMEMLGGKLNLNGFYSSLNPESPNVSMMLAISDFNIKNTYEAFNTVQIFAPLSKYIDGTFSTVLTYDSQLDKAMNPDYKTMDVTGMLKTSSLAIVNAPAFSKLAKELKYDKFNNLTTKPVLVDFEIHDGNLAVKPFTVEIDNIPAEVSGSANIDRTVNYRMKMDVPSDKLGASANQMISSLQANATKAGLDLGNTKTIPVNAFITGPAMNPDVKVSVSNPAQDVQDQLEDKVKDEIQKVKDQAMDEIEKKKQEALLEAERLKKQAQDSLNNVIDKQKQELERQKKEAEEKAKKKLEEEAKKKLKKIFG